ncbi:MAG: hypothetical protein ACRYGI_18900 [Janthinobacterium lividum]
MRRALLVLAMIGTATVAHAQTGPGPTRTGQTEVAPRNPGAATTGTLPASQHKMNNTVDRIDQHLLNAEKDRPNLPGQTPSPSQTSPGGTASPSGVSRPR